MKQKLLVIIGPTSTGKTDVALEFAKRLNGEIISADSRQVYKHLDIGTGKLPGNDSGIANCELGDGFWMINGIKIWMYDVVNPDARFSLYEYLVKANEVLQKISKEEKLPIITGGTGLYIRSLIEGVSDFGVSENIKLRGALADLSADEIANKILHLSPETHKKLNDSDIKNKRRLIRTYEKLLSPSKTLRIFSGVSANTDILKIGLSADIKILRERIKCRLVKRINEGMVEESQKLMERGILTFERMDQLGLEYRYIAKYLRHEIKSKDELIELLSVKVGQYAKRQLTWFNKEKDVVWFNIMDPDFTRKLDSKIHNWYNISRESN